MPCFNAETYVREAIESVLRQTYTGVELIVVDDGSTDRSRAIVRGFGRDVRLIEQENRGPFPARNRGVAASTGEYVAFLDADDYWTPDCLSELHRALCGTDAVLSYCGWQNIGVAGGRGEPYIPPDYEADNKLAAFLRAAAPWPIHAALMRRSVWDAVGGFDLDLRTCMDYDLWLRVAVASPIRRVEKVMAVYRHHDEGQITSVQWRQARNSWLVKKKFIREHPEITQALGPSKLAELVDGGLLRRGYDAYWRRDLVTARRIFRIALRAGGWRLKDLKYLLPSLLPERTYASLIGAADAKTRAHH